MDYTNVRTFYQILTTDKISEMSDGKIKKMSPEAAIGLIANWQHETGDPTLSKLDVVEGGSGAGRGLSQYTGFRRDAYDAWRKEALKQGFDLNSPEVALQHFADEYSGKLDKYAGGKSLIGYSKALERMPLNGTAGQYATYFSKNYFMPGVPHEQERIQHAVNLMKNKSMLEKVKTPKPETTVKPSNRQLSIKSLGNDYAKINPGSWLF